MREHRLILKKMDNTKPIILIIAPPSDLQIGLQALLTTRLQVDVLVTAEGSSALIVIERHNPTLVIIDHDLPRKVAPMIIQNIKTSWPDVRCIILVNNEEDRQEVLDSGADLILVKGLPGVLLVAKIEKLLCFRTLDCPISKDQE